MTNFYVTYGFGTNLRNCYSVVQGHDEVDATREIPYSGRTFNAFWD